MDRRSFLTKAAVGGATAAAATTLAAPMYAQGKRTLALVTTWGRGLAALDATEWIGSWADEKVGFSEITKIYYPAGVYEPGVALSLATKRGEFDSLTPSQQQIIEIASPEVHQHNLTLFLANNAAALALSQVGRHHQEVPRCGL